jgi:phosphotransferase system HPr (HPr) family protein
MKIKKTTIENVHGLHLRVAAEVASAAKRYDVDIRICKGCMKADGCSVLQLLMLDAPCGTEVDVTIEGENECAAMDALLGLFSDGGGI